MTETKIQLLKHIDFLKYPDNHSDTDNYINSVFKPDIHIKGW